MKDLAAQFHRFHDKTRPIIGTLLYGLAASLAAVGFQLAINRLYNWCYKVPAADGFWRFIWVTLAVIVVTSLITGWLLNSFAPEAAGSGIPQVKLRFLKEFGSAPRRIAWIKFVAGVISIGGGQSLGREGPTVQIGSNLASTLAGILGVTKQNRRAASAAGAAAGLSAAFNAPLASVAFVLEEIIGDLNSRSLGAVLLASVVGAFVVHAFIGAQPAFVLPEIHEPSWRGYLLMPISAAFAALVGIIFQRVTLSLRSRCKNVRTIPRWLLPLFGGLTTWVIGMAVFAMTRRLGVFALGYDDLSDALVHGMAWRIALLLVAGKLIATIASYGFGGCGGIFSPNLFLGAMCGIVVAGLGAHFLALNRSDDLLLAIGGMSACLGAVVQAPVTAILIIFEMTHQFAVVPGLMLAGLVSQALARSLERHNFYDEVLLQDGHQIEHLIPPRDLRSWQNLPISAIANFKPVVITETNRDALKQLLTDHPYRHFPVVENGRVKGIVTRREIEAAVLEGRALQFEPALSRRPGDSIRDSQAALIESTTNTVVLTDEENGKLLALVTLHDLLRAQVAMSDRERIR
ncbi:MAG: chloride channel protein [Chthoniobacterales bacterium]|nr:MAG: chloride channel protein [Chthoniobacterales bacterium]